MSVPTQAPDTTPRSEVVALLTEQRDLCRHLAQFVQMQRSLITGNEPERLLVMLGDRQRLLDRMEKVAQELRAYQGNWRQVRARLTPADAGHADSLIAEVNRLLAAILQTDEADAQLLSARKNATAQDMGQVRQGRQAGAAYAAATGGASVTHVEWVDE